MKSKMYNYLLFMPFTVTKIQRLVDKVGTAEDVTKKL